MFVILYGERRLAGRSAGALAEGSPIREAAGARGRAVSGWVQRHGATTRAGWARRWDAIDARAQALVEDHTALRRAAPPVVRPQEAVPVGADDFEIDEGAPDHVEADQIEAELLDPETTESDSGPELAADHRAA